MMKFEELDSLKFSVKAVVKEILRTALTYNKTIWTTESISKYHGIPMRSTFRYLSILRQYGFARHITERCKKTGKIKSHRWVFYNEPQRS